MEPEEVRGNVRMAATVEDYFSDEDEEEFEEEENEDLIPDESVNQGGGEPPAVDIYTEPYPFTAHNKPVTIPMSHDEFPPQRSADAPWEPFQSMAEWEMAEWLMSCGLSNGERDRFFKLNEAS